MQAVHPRRRGEHVGRRRPSVDNRGSSPQARGTPLDERLAALKNRFIPAGAGNTCARPRKTRAIPVHPRRRGEHPRPHDLHHRHGGSSPQARGTPQDSRSAAPLFRFIPAGAGNTQARSRSGVASRGSSPQARGTLGVNTPCWELSRFIPAGAGNTRNLTKPFLFICGSSPQARGTPTGPSDWYQGYAVHPRRRGEHAYLLAVRESALGSSPQARGTREFSTKIRSISRFIPAGAGNTLGCIANHLAVLVHPRRRGEHGTHLLPDGLYIGSSPQARGTRTEDRIEHRIDRFIPAGAGNTLPAYTVDETGTVHPRRRGEHPMPSCSAIVASGSSPQARGTLPHQQRPLAVDRFIPAGAGNTRWAPLTWPMLSGSSPQARGTHQLESHAAPPARFIPAGAGNTNSSRLMMRIQPVHPRRRGEHRPGGQQHGLAVGSSPQARGTRVQGPGGADFERFIPAGAGNTPPARPMKS